MRGATFEFEGKMLTIAQIRACVPVLSSQAIRAHLKAGRSTRHAMLTFDSTAASVRGGRSAAARAKRAGSATLWSGTCF